MKFKIDKHDISQVAALRNNIYKTVKRNTHLNQHSIDHIGYWDWEIIYGPFETTVTPLYPDRVPRYMESISRGDILPPIVMGINGRILDGQHKSVAYTNLGITEACIIKPVGLGDGDVVKDLVYSPLLKDYDLPKNIPEKVSCIVCGKIMKRTKKGVVCECGRRVKHSGQLGWTVINKKI